MHATGLFFLRAAPDLRVGAGGAPAELRLHVIERDAADPRAMLNELIAIWRDAAAFDFAREHAGELRPGRGLLLTIDRLRLDPKLGAIGNVLGCELAPLAPSWIKHAAQPAAAPTPTQESCPANNT